MSGNSAAKPWPRRCVALVALALAALAAAPGSGAAQRAADNALLRTYQPVLVFHPAEPFRPTKVQSFVEDSVLQRFVGTSPQQLPLDPFWVTVDEDPGPGNLPSGEPGAFYRLDQTACEADAALAGRDCYAEHWRAGAGGDATYARVVRSATHVVLQYWLFYYDNPLILPPTPFGAFWQSHEGDWELVNVILDANERPLEAAYSQHCTGERRSWANVEKSPLGSTHPVAYVGLGSHANFFGPGTGPFGAVPLEPTCVPPAVRDVLPLLPFLQVVDQVVDGRTVGAAAGPPGSGGEPLTIHRIEDAPWADFGGFWGEAEYFFTPIPLGPVPGGTAVPVGVAPRTPTHQNAWNTGVVLGWPKVD
jgi:hypothetical protein